MEQKSLQSGPWSGWSIQDGNRIAESIHLTITGDLIEGAGSDKDGDFRLEGHFDDRTNTVRLTRRYTYTTEPSQEGVGIPYEYNGTWDGKVVSGRWNPRFNPSYGGPFEMWPDEGEESYSLADLKHEVLLTS